MSEKRKSADRRATIAMTNTVGQIGCMTTLASAMVIGLAFFVGQLLDKQFGTSPWLLLITLSASFPVTLFVIVRLSLSLMERAQNMTEKIKREAEIEEDSNLSES